LLIEVGTSDSLVLSLQRTREPRVPTLGTFSDGPFPFQVWDHTNFPSGVGLKCSAASLSAVCGSAATAVSTNNRRRGFRPVEPTARRDAAATDRLKSARPTPPLANT
jgi:hypothetical protein